ncbi:TPA: hypothetical protein N0F65_008822 [Lagenidium giganteum]|uniref:Uncharacterized protein n=1 Tax=Lagenidium giganteum TaxID=4803 RepID=A0AAV2YYN7_9STRA|nr:TPA: hypothetical protein N0F65_008822 [Lagenidium giganteum]
MNDLNVRKVSNKAHSYHLHSDFDLERAQSFPFTSQNRRSTTKLSRSCARKRPTPKTIYHEAHYHLVSLIARASLPASLLYYISDRRYPVEYGLLLAAGSDHVSVIETKIRTHLEPTNKSNTQSWVYPGSRNVNLGRSLQKMPIRNCVPRSPTSSGVHRDTMLPGKGLTTSALQRFMALVVSLSKTSHSSGTIHCCCPY